MFAVFALCSRKPSKRRLKRHKNTRFSFENRAFLWSYWPDSNRRPADYERSSELPMAAKGRFPPLSAWCFGRFCGLDLVSAPLIPLARFRVWVSVWVKSHRIAKPIFTTRSRLSRFQRNRAGQKLQRCNQRLAIIQLRERIL